MSYGAAQALQVAVYQQLATDPTLTGLVGSAIYDTLPGGILRAVYGTLGPELAGDKSDKTGSGAEHEFTVSVVTETAGFSTAKAAAAAVSDALVDAPLVLARGSPVALNFYRATAQRIGTGDQQQINLVFRARIDVA